MKRNHVLTAILLALLVLAAAACASAAEIRPVPLDHDTLDLGKGVFNLVVRGGDRAEAAGGFTAVLYLEDRYDGEQIRKMAPGDTVWADDRKWTVKEVVIHSLRETPDVPTDYEIYTEEDLGAEEYLAFTPCEDGTFLAVMGDWTPMTLAGSVRVLRRSLWGGVRIPGRGTGPGDQHRVSPRPGGTGGRDVPAPAGLEILPRLPGRPGHGGDHRLHVRL